MLLRIRRRFLLRSAIGARRSRQQIPRVPFPTAVPFQARPEVVSQAHRGVLGRRAPRQTAAAIAGVSRRKEPRAGATAPVAVGVSSTGGLGGTSRPTPRRGPLIRIDAKPPRIGDLTGGPVGGPGTGLSRRPVSSRPLTGRVRDLNVHTIRADMGVGKGTQGGGVANPKAAALTGPIGRPADAADGAKLVISGPVPDTTRLARGGVGEA